MDSFEQNRRRLALRLKPKKVKKKVPDEPKQTKGRAKRRRYTTTFKCSMVMKLDKLVSTGRTLNAASTDLGISASLLSKWRSMHAKGVLKEPGFEGKMTVNSKYTATVFGAAFRTLDKAVIKKVKKSRKKKVDVTTEDLQTWAKEIEPGGIGKVKFGRKWAANFKRRLYRHRCT